MCRETLFFCMYMARSTEDHGDNREYAVYVNKNSACFWEESGDWVPWLVF